MCKMQFIRCTHLVPFLVCSKLLYFSNRLGVLPLELNKLLIIVVVLSMALTPLLNEIGKKAAEIIDEKFQVKEVCNQFMLSMSNIQKVGFSL